MGLDICLAQAKLIQGGTSGNSELRLHEVNIGDFFGDGVLDLDARVHFDEDVLAGIRANCVNQKLNGSSVLVTNLLGEGKRIAE